MATDQAIEEDEWIKSWNVKDDSGGSSVVVDEINGNKVVLFVNMDIKKEDENEMLNDAVVDGEKVEAIIVIKKEVENEMLKDVVVDGEKVEAIIVKKKNQRKSKINGKLKNKL
jgi:hypothetical protein